MHPGQEVDGVGFEKEHLWDHVCRWLQILSLWIGQLERDRETEGQRQRDGSLSENTVCFFLKNSYNF